MRDLEKFRGIHQGETVLIVGLGENLRLTPPEWFKFPSFSVNAAHRWDGTWIPDYYATVDTRNYQEYGEAIAQKFAHIPKFVQSPRLDKWQGENFYRFPKMDGPLWNWHRGPLWQDDIINNPITYANIMHVVFKICWYMGFTTMLIIGMEHRQHYGDRHFFGIDIGTNADSPTDIWFEGYRQMRIGLEQRGVRLLNISQNTYVPEHVLPREDWRDWCDSEAVIKAYAYA